MGIRTKNHFSAACKHFTGKLVNNCLMRWYIDSAVFLCTGQSKHVVIFVDGSTDCTKAVMTVGQYIRNWKLFQSGCSGCLDNSNICNVMGSQLIKFDFQLLHAARCVVVL